MITSIDFANRLRKIEKKTKQTNEFENEKDDAGIRKYAQKSKRWWDKFEGTQKAHVVCWFERKGCIEGSTQECIKDNLIEKKICKDCCFESDIKSNKKKYGQELDAEKVFNRMQRPEMYLYIAEALDVVNEESLKNCIKELKKSMDENPRKWKKIINSYINWDMVKEKYNK